MSYYLYRGEYTVFHFRADLQEFIRAERRPSMFSHWPNAVQLPLYVERREDNELYISWEQPTEGYFRPYRQLTPDDSHDCGAHSVNVGFNTIRMVCKVCDKNT